MEGINTNIDFIGPTKLKFPSFESQAAYYLDTFCHDWRNYENPASHLIPRVFDYKSAEIDDEVVDQVQNSPNCTSNQRRVITERISDQAEHIIYRAINQLISDKVVDPFIAIHNLNIDQRRINILKQIYPSIYWITAEYDFVLVGEKIGIIAIEVKSSHFHRRNDFGRKSNHLPALLKKAIDQLDRVEEFLKNVCEITGGKLPPYESYLRKILFAPNLERSRHEAWKSCLPASHIQGLRSKIDTLHLLFKEDTEIDTQNPLPSIYQSLKKLILDFPIGISAEIYETYAKIFTGISSIIGFPGNHPVISIDPFAFSQSMAIAKESDRIRNQQPSNGKRSANSALISVSKILGNQHLKSLSIFLLTPEQQNALKGGNRQVLIGPAGTGKTLLIQAKAMELLSLGESVIIFSTNYYKVKHKEIFDAIGLSNYEIHHWPSFVAKAKRSMVRFFGPSINIDLYNRKFKKSAQQISGNGHFQAFRKITLFKNRLYRFLKSQLSEKHLFFDDSMIVYHDRGSWSLFLACIAILKGTKSTIWTAADLYGSSSETMLSPEQYLTILGENFNFSLIYLNRVMRSSEEIYRLVHSEKIHEWDSLAYRFGLMGKNQISSIGHKVQGIPPMTFRKNFSTEAEAFWNLEQELPATLQNLISHDLPNDQFLGIIMSVESPGMWKNVIHLARRIGEHLNIGILTSTVSNNDYSMIISSAMTSDHRILFNRDQITIASSRCILSFEWPVVVHILVCPKHLEESNETRFYQYQARSRAITTFIEFFYTFDRKDFR